MPQPRKMLVVEVRLWTNDIAEEAGSVAPKHAWSSGVVTMGSSPLHGISPQKEVHFNSLTEVSSAVEKILKRAGVTIHPDPGMIRVTASTSKKPAKS